MEKKYKNAHSEVYGESDDSDDERVIIILILIIILIGWFFDKRFWVRLVDCSSINIRIKIILDMIKI